MRPFRKFFFISLAFFLFIFFAKFLLMAFVAAGILTFISFAIKGFRRFSRDEYFYREDWRSLPAYDGMELNQWSRKVEPLYLGQNDKDDRWQEDFRSITVY